MEVWEKDIEVVFNLVVGWWVLAQLKIWDWLQHEWSVGRVKVESLCFLHENNIGLQHIRLVCTWRIGPLPKIQSETQLKPSCVIVPCKCPLELGRSPLPIL